MGESIISVTQGSGKNLRTYDRTIGGTLVQEQYILPGEYGLASYSVIGQAVSTATTGSHLLACSNGGSNYVRVRRISITQDTLAGAASQALIQVLRTTTAPSGGTAVTAAPYDSGAAASGVTWLKLPTAGTEGVYLLSATMPLVAAWPNAAPGWTWEQHPGQSPIMVPPGSSNGIAVRINTGIASGKVTVMVEYVEVSF